MSRRCTVFVGNLPPNVQKPDVEDVFQKYGPIAKIDVKANGSEAPIAFVEYEDPRDCEDAIRGRDGYDMDGYRLRCDVSTRGNGGGGHRNGDKYDKGGDRDRQGIRGSRPPGPPSRRTEWRARIGNLPKSGSWQDLKDHMRAAAEVTFSEVYGDGNGAVEFSCYEDMKNAIRKLDDTKFKSHEGETAYVTVEEDRGGARTTGIPRNAGGRSGFRDRSPGGRRGGGGGRHHNRRSPSYSPPSSRKGSYRPSPSYRGRSRSRSPRRNSPSPSPHRRTGYYN